MSCNAACGFNIGELVPCPAASYPDAPGTLLREVAFRDGTWLSDELAHQQHSCWILR